jgi:hypothetical protein
MKNLSQIKTELLNRVLEQVGKFSEEELTKLVLEQILRERTELVKKLLGLEADTNGRRNQRGAAIDSAITDACDKIIVPELAKMVEAEKEKILQMIRDEFIDSGYLLHRARSHIFDNVDQWIDECAKEVRANLQADLIKESYESNDTNQKGTLA